MTKTPSATASSPDWLGRLTGSEKRARIRVLELENFRQAARIDELEEELRAAAARERFLSLRLSQQMKRTAAACAAAGDESGR